MDVKAGRATIEFAPLGDEVAEWKSFLATSNNGTVFHDLDFLSYHAPRRFETHHLVARQGDRLLALLPAAVVTEPEGLRILKSPYGASVGGFVFARGELAVTIAALVGALKDYVVSQGMDGIELRLGPPAYCREPNDDLGFALMAGGFRLACRWLCPMLFLPGDPEAVLTLCTPNRLRDLRSALRRGVQCSEVGLDGLPNFYRILLLNADRHNAVPTHTEPELRDLMARLPAAMRLFVAELDGQTVAGIFVFVLNEVAAYTFYIAQDDRHKSLNPVTALVLHVAQRLDEEGFRVLDFGPSSTNDMTINEGVALFKERFGAHGFCRDTWRWVRDADSPSVVEESLSLRGPEGAEAIP